MGEILLIILGFFLLIIGYILFTPIRVAIDLRLDTHIAAVSSVSVFPFRFSFALGEKKGAPRKRKKPRKPRKSKKKAESRIAEESGRRFEFTKLNRGDIVLLLETAKELFRFLGLLIKSPKYFIKADLTGGVSEPDTTGMIYGVYEAVKPVLPDSFSLYYRPDFLAERFNGSVSAGLAIRIVTVLKEFLFLIFRLPIIRLIKLYRKL